jgi:hypothetical protein
MQHRHHVTLMEAALRSQGLWPKYTLVQAPADTPVHLARLSLCVHGQSGETDFVTVEFETGFTLFYYCLKLPYYTSIIVASSVLYPALTNLPPALVKSGFLP